MPANKVPYVDPETCIGCNACAALCPSVYEMQDDGKSKVVSGSGDSEENIQRSIETCPVTAISWQDPGYGDASAPSVATPSANSKPADASQASQADSATT